MGKIILQILFLLVPALLQWWERKQKEKLRKEREARRDVVNADPAGEFMRTFNPADSTNTAHTANPDQPDPDSGGGNNNG